MQKYKYNSKSDVFYKSNGKNNLILRQTGSGNTYTMEGMDDEDIKRGIISRTSSKIFQETSDPVLQVYSN